MNNMEHPIITSLLRNGYEEWEHCTRCGEPLTLEWFEADDEKVCSACMITEAKNECDLALAELYAENMGYERKC